MSRERQIAVASGALLLAAAYSLPELSGTHDCFPCIATLTELKQVREALWVFQVEHGRFPAEQEGLNVLQPLLKRSVSRDSWGNPYVYVLVHVPEPIVLSYGADGRPGGSGFDADLSPDWFTNKR